MAHNFWAHNCLHIHKAKNDRVARVYLDDIFASRLNKIIRIAFI